MKFADLTHCPRCDARYQPSDRWHAVRYHPGTTGDYDVLHHIPADVCPICRTPAKASSDAPAANTGQSSPEAA